MRKNKRKYWLAAVAVLVLVLPALAAAGPFDNLPFDKLPLDRIPRDKVPFAYTELYVLGNSLSDVGNVFIYTQGQIPPYPYYMGRFSNGLNYSDYLADMLMLPNDPFLAGGTNFAWGGAKTSGGTSPSGLLQLNDYLAYAAGNPLMEDALFVVFLGGNNMFDIISDAGAALLQGQDPAPVIEAGVAQGMADMGAILGGLIQAGAVNIAVPNVPNMGLAPGVTIPLDGVLVPLATGASQAWNTALEVLLESLDPEANIMRVDVYGLLNEVVADPAAFGLEEAVDPCIDKFNMTICANPDKYLFWDLEHPTTVGHMLLADKVYDAVYQGLLPAAVRK